MKHLRICLAFIGIFALGLVTPHRSKAQVRVIKSYLDSLFNKVNQKERATYLRLNLEFENGSPDSVIEYYTTGQKFRSGKIRKGGESGSLEFLGQIFEYYRNGKIRGEWDEKRRTYLQRNQEGEITSIQYFQEDKSFSEVRYNKKGHLEFMQVPKKGLKGSIPTALKESGFGNVFWVEGKSNTFSNQNDTCKTFWFTDSIQNMDTLFVHAFLKRVSSGTGGYYGLLYSNDSSQDYYHFYLRDDKTVGIAYDNFNKKILRFGEKQLDFSSSKPGYNKITLKITKEKIWSYLNDEFIKEEENIIPYLSEKPNRFGIRICRWGKVNLEKIEIVKYSQSTRINEIMNRAKR